MPAPRDAHQHLSQFKLADAEHRAWCNNFSDAVRCSQIDEDLYVARTVGGVLISIVAGGTLLGLLAVVLAMVLSP